MSIYVLCIYVQHHACILCSTIVYSSPVWALLPKGGFTGGRGTRAVALYLGVRIYLFESVFKHMWHLYLYTQLWICFLLPYAIACVPLHSVSFQLFAVTVGCALTII